MRIRREATGGRWRDRRDKLKGKGQMNNNDNEKPRHMRRIEASDGGEGLMRRKADRRG